MLHQLRCVCDDPGCDRELSEADLCLTYRAYGTERRAYECICGAVTITVAKTSEPER